MEQSVESNTKQIIHRDLKPENILITSNGRHVKLIDFGFSDTDSYAVLKEPAGARRYAAPEQLKKGEKIDARADIYALGIILKELGSEDKATSSVARACSCEDITRRPSDVVSIPELIKKRRMSLLIRKLLLVLAFIVLLVGYYKYCTIENVEKVTDAEMTDTLHRSVIVEQMLPSIRHIIIEKNVLVIDISTRTLSRINCIKKSNCPYAKNKLMTDATKPPNTNINTNHPFNFLFVSSLYFSSNFAYNFFVPKNIPIVPKIP